MEYSALNTNLNGNPTLPTCFKLKEINKSIEQSPYWEANNFSGSREILRILWNLKVHYRIHKCPPSVPILSQIYPFLSFHLISWIPILILYFHLYPNLSSAFSYQVCPPKLHASFLSPIRATCLAHLILRVFYHPNRIWWGAQNTKFLVMKSFPLLCYFVLLKLGYRPQHPILGTPSVYVPPSVWETKFTSIQNNRQNYKLIKINI